MSDSLRILWTVAQQAPLSMEFSRQEQWIGLPLPSPGDLPNTGVKPRSSTLKADSLPIELPKKPKNSVQPIPFSFCIALKLSRDGVVGQMRKVIGSS